MMPNMMPRVGPGRYKNVFYNTGHGHLGWTLAAATADAVASMIQETAGEARKWATLSAELKRQEGQQVLANGGEISGDSGPRAGVA